MSVVQPDEDPAPPGSGGSAAGADARAPAEVARWAWPAVVAVTALLFVGETLSAADSGWPLGATLVAISMAGFVVLTSIGWYRSRRRRD